ncbi:MAG TPA: metalloregulator ArsR/SmtB family transcription factor [Candidatus Deferrimicrobium sp.]|nr:metalloregulator ArsR/SmtB family transcription factor [Candidatus Deferrimicrobium sp.]
MDEIDTLQAEIMRTLAHPRRLRIIHRLSGGPVEVGRIAADLGISQPNASQHLAVMRAVGVVEAERHGREVHYRLSDPEIVAACGLMRRVLARRLDRLAGLSDAAHLGPDAGRAPADVAPATAPITPPIALATAPSR